MFKLAIVSLLSLIVVAVYGGPITFHDCGHGEVKQVSVEGCSGDECTLHKGQMLSFEASFLANQDTTHTHFDVKAFLGEIPLPVPLKDHDGCKHLKCPLKKGEVYVYSMNHTLPQFVPTVKNGRIQVHLYGDSGQMVCVTVSHINIE